MKEPCRISDSTPYRFGNEPEPSEYVVVTMSSPNCIDECSAYAVFPREYLGTLSQGQIDGLLFEIAVETFGINWEIKDD
jgi:hypothetical protein